MSTEHLLGDLGAILEALMAADDRRRGEAETHLRHITVQSPAEVLLLLAQIGAQGVGGFQTDHRFLSLILLKRLSFTSLPGLFLNDNSHHATAPFDVVAERTRGRIEVVLCAGLRDEVNVRMRKGLGSCAAGWAEESSRRQRPCLNLPPVLLELTNSEHPFHRFTPFQLLNTVPTLLIDSVSEPLPAQQLAAILIGGMMDPSVDVRVEAIKAMRSIVMEGLTGREREQIGPPMINMTIKTLLALPPALLPLALEPLVDLASTHPNLFMSSLDEILPYLLSILSPPAALLPDRPFSPYSTSSLPFEDFEQSANLSTEVLLCLCELRPTQMTQWQHGRAGRELVGLLLARMVASLAEYADSDEDWVNETNLANEDEAYPAAAEEALDRLAVAIGGEIVLPALSDHAQALISHPNWRCRYTALLAIANVAEGSLEELGPKLHDVLTLISPSAKDDHPRARYAFLQCLGQLCTDCDGAMQLTYAKEVQEICLTLLLDPVTRVQAHAAACVCNLYDSFDESNTQSLKSFLGPTVQTLLSAFVNGPLYLQEQIVSSLSVVAIAAQSAFAPYFAGVIEMTMSILRSQTGQAHYKLVGRAIECGATLGLAVGKNLFAPHAVDLAHAMMTIQNSIVASDDPRTAYLVEGWASLCRTLGNDFVPFLPHVMPPLLKSASYKPAVQHKSLSLTSDEENEMATTHTAEMSDKVLAFDNLTVYAYTLRSHFQPWLARSMELSLEALTFPHSEEVRESAAFLVPALLQVARESGAWSDQSGKLEEVFRTLFNAMAKEVDFGFLALLYKSFTDALQVIQISLPDDLNNRLYRTTEAHLVDLLGRREDRRAQSPYMDDDDREMYIEEETEEDACLDHMAKAMGGVLDAAGNGRGVSQPTVDALCAMIARVRSLGLEQGQ